MNQGQNHSTYTRGKRHVSIDIGACLRSTEDKLLTHATDVCLDEGEIDLVYRTREVIVRIRAEYRVSGKIIVRMDR